MTIQDIRRQARRRLKSLSPDRVKVANDFLAYLEERESNEATKELLDIPGLAEEIKKAEKDAASGRLTSWRKVRRDV